MRLKFRKMTSFKNSRSRLLSRPESRMALSLNTLMSKSVNKWSLSRKAAWTTESSFKILWSSRRSLTSTRSHWGSLNLRTPRVKVRRMAWNSKALINSTLRRKTSQLTSLTTEGTLAPSLPLRKEFTSIIGSNISKTRWWPGILTNKRQISSTS